jgi:hypothetical protein
MEHEEVTGSENKGKIKIKMIIVNNLRKVEMKWLGLC